MAATYDVLVAGSYTIDLIFTGMDHLPVLGEDLVAKAFAMLPGESYNSAVAMHRLGLHVGWAGDFGNDDFSRFALQKARQEGLDERLFVHHDHPLRRISVAASLPHDRAFLTYYDPDPTLPAILKAMTKTSARSLYLPGLYYGPLMETGLKLARLKRMELLMDGNMGQPHSLQDPAVRKAISSTALFFLNAQEAHWLTGLDAIIEALHVLGKFCPQVIIKDGPNGAYTLEAGQVYHVPGLELSPVDTTGAGDCFNAGFIKAWLDGRNIHECLQWGNIVGGLSTLGMGATGQVVRIDDIQRYL